MTALKQALDRLRTYAYLRDVHPTEWFEDFDKHNQGRITETQFRRAFEFMRYPWRPGEFEAVAKEFRTGDGTINYRQFCDALSKIFTNKDLEKDPTGKVKDSKKVVTRTLGKIQANTDPQFEALLAKMAHQVLTRGVHIRESYMDFDRHNSGNVTQSQFFRAMPFRDLSAAEMQLLVKRYADPILRDVNYKKLHNDVNEYIQVMNAKKDTLVKSRGFELLPHQRDSLSFRDFNHDPATVLQNFANHVYEKRIRIRDFFEQHDPLRQGRILVDKFEGTMTLFGFPWTQDDLDYIVGEYKVNVNYTNYVRYRDFCADVEAMADMEHAEMKTREVKIPPTETEAILDRIRQTIVRFRINVLPTIQDFDRMGRGYVTKLQFQRALSTLRIHVSNQELALLADLYEVEDKGLDFYKFIEDVDPSHNQKRRSFRPIGTTRESIEDVYGKTPAGDRFVTGDVADQLIYESHKGLIPKVNEKTNYDDLMREIQKWAFVNSVHFHDYMEDFDKFKWNEITATQFRSAMNMSNYRLTEKEYELLIEHYASDTRKGFVKWRKFADDVMQFVAPMDLEKVPTTTPLSPKETLNMQTRSITATPSAEIERILDIVARFVKTRRVSLPEQFKDKDRMNHRKINQSQFAQVLQLLGLFLTKQELDKLCVFYNDPETNFVEYPKFIADVDYKVGLIFGDRASTALLPREIPPYGFENSDFLIQQRYDPNDDLTWKTILEKLSAIVYRRRLRLTEFFEGFDPLHHGTCTKQKFRTVCGQLNLPLNETEIQTVLKKFTVKNMDDMFNYRKFCKKVNKVFGPTELNRKPQKVPTPKHIRPNPSETLQTLTPAEERELNEILERMKIMVRTRRMNIRDQFCDYDIKPHKNYISMQQFKQSITRLGLTTRVRDLELLCKKYKCTDMADMNYLAFCRAIDPEF